MSSKLNVVGALKAPGQEFPFEADCCLEEMQVLGDPVRFEQISARGVLLSSEEKISVHGEVTAEVVSQCARCLKEVRAPIQAGVDAVYGLQPDPEDPDQYVYEASQVDLTDAIKDALVLALPLRFLCREDCKGLCPKCGADLNEGPCTCQEGDDDLNPFAALRSIVVDNREV